MSVISGSTGYAESLDRFIEATHSIDFFDLHKPIIDYVPIAPSRVLDLGAGIGRDAAVLSDMGHQVVAIEPAISLLNTAKELYDREGIAWVNDSLPLLRTLDADGFDFVLASAVWHHLDDEEQKQAVATVAGLLRPGGIFAVSLRNGPPGIGTIVYPTCGDRTIECAALADLVPLLHLKNQPSLLPGKNRVSWTHLALQKQETR